MVCACIPLTLLGSPYLVEASHATEWYYVRSPALFETSSDILSLSPASSPSTLLPNYEEVVLFSMHLDSGA